MDDPEFPSITYKLDTETQLVPIIREKGIRVYTIVIVFHRWQESEAEIVKQYSLPVSVVREALSFYQAYKNVLDTLIAGNIALEGRNV